MKSFFFKGRLNVRLLGTHQRRHPAVRDSLVPQVELDQPALRRCDRCREVRRALVPDLVAATTKTPRRIQQPMPRDNIGVALHVGGGASARLLTASCQTYSQ